MEVERMRGMLAKVAVLSLLALPMPTMAADAKMPIAQIGNNKVKLEVAASPSQIEHGLMYRTALPEDQGMVFLFRPQSPVKFWMAHCFIFLDMLMIKDGKIVKIFENVPPCKEADTSKCPTYPAMDQPSVDVTEVVEVIGGWSKRHSVKEGDPVKFFMPNGKPAFELKGASAKSN
jgi:uncharacterized membrane protein (UPF0127 family)